MYMLAIVFLPQLIILCMHAIFIYQPHFIDYLFVTPVGGRGEEVANNDSTTELMSLLSRATKRGHIAYNGHTSVNWHTQEYIDV